MNDEDQDDKTKELPLGKETEANLFKSRSIFIYGPINQELAQKVCSQLVALAAASDEDIRIYVNSPGGHVESGDSIHDRGRAGCLFRCRRTHLSRAPQLYRRLAHVRGRLEALVSRAVMYELVALGETLEVEGQAMFAVRSAGEVFAMMPADELDALSR